MAHFNITGSTGVDIELIAEGTNAKPINSMLMTNIHDTADATVSLYINSNTLNKKFYILHTVAIPADTSLLLDNSSVFRFSRSQFGLYLTVGASDTLDILIS